MELNSIEVDKTGISSRFRMLKSLFVLGFFMNIVLNFVPLLQLKVRGDLITHSALSLIRTISGTNPGLTFVLVLIFASNILFIALAFAYPKRFIFIVASSFTVIMLIWNFFQGTNPNVIIFLLPQVLGYIANALTLIGFFIKPPIAQP